MLPQFSHLLKNTRHTPILLGVFLCLCLFGCSKQKSTPTWQDRQSPTPDQELTQQGNPDKLENEPSPVRFLCYNLHNYLNSGQNRSQASSKGSDRQVSKPANEISQLVATIRLADPDILGVCEIGSKADLADLQARLKKQGINLPYSHYKRGYDPVRAQGLLSRLPIVATGQPIKKTYNLSGRHFQMSRGILDATVQMPHKQLRLLGIHFKSKRPSKNADQELMRRNESILLRQHIDSILKKHPHTLLMAYGDFNDTRSSRTLKTAQGRSGSRNQMTPLALKDSRGESWTHHWKHEDLYSRIDFVLVNRELSPWIDLENSHVIGNHQTPLASDHRALLVVIE